MIYKKIKDIRSYIFADNENFSLEHRLLLAAIVIGILISIFGSVINLILTTSLIAVFIPLGLSVVVLVLYYFVRFKKIVEPITIPIVIVAILGISIIWIFNGGINGSNIMPAFVILVLGLIVIKAEIKKYIIILFISINVAILLVQKYKPDLIINFPTEESRWYDNLLTMLYSSYLIYLIITFVHKNYTIERQRAEENEANYRKLFEQASKAEIIIKQQNDELVKLNSDKDRFMSILSHDLKSPFNTILGYTELLEEDFYKFNTSEILERLGIIKDMSQKTFNLLEDLLLWTKSQSGKLTFQPKQVDFNKICNEIIESFKLSAIAKNININYFSTHNITLQADENMFKTILRNLISNAIKFTNPNGRIKVYAETMDNGQMAMGSGESLPIVHYPLSIVITIADNGVGIDQNDIPKLWNIVTKHSTYGTANEKGTGLGLILCKEFVEKHGGKIWCESKVGKGSEFKFTMPPIFDK